jgi:hypothetical protein
MRWVGAAEKGFLPHGRWCWMVWIAASVSCVYGADRGARTRTTTPSHWLALHGRCLPLHTLDSAPSWLLGWDFIFYWLKILHDLFFLAISKISYFFWADLAVNFSEQEFLVSTVWYVHLYSRYSFRLEIWFRFKMYAKIFNILGVL